MIDMTKSREGQLENEVKLLKSAVAKISLRLAEMEKYLFLNFDGFPTSKFKIKIKPSKVIRKEPIPHEAYMSRQASLQVLREMLDEESGDLDEFPFDGNDDMIDDENEVKPFNRSFDDEQDDGLDQSEAEDDHEEDISEETKKLIFDALSANNQETNGAEGNRDRQSKLISVDDEVIERAKEVKPKILRRKKGTRTFWELKCMICDRVFRGTQARKTLFNHLDLHRKGKRFKCKYCDATFQQSRPMRSHVLRVHEPVKKFSCSFCLMRFVASADLRKHVKTHTGQRDKICKTCGKGFIQESNYQAHLATHTDHKSVLCQICGKSFYHKSNLRQHVRLAHETQKVDEHGNNLRQRICPLCKKTFSGSNTLQKHLKKIHSKSLRQMKMEAEHSKLEAQIDGNSFPTTSFVANTIDQNSINAAVVTTEDGTVKPLEDGQTLAAVATILSEQEEISLTI